MMNLQAQYNDWRNTGIKESEGTDIPFTWDCGEESARVDFSGWAELPEVISIEDMQELEENFEYRCELTEEQTERIENALVGYAGNAVDRFWELYNEGAEEVGEQPDEYVEIETYIEYLEGKHN